MRTFCIFSAQYFPHMGGVENYTYNLSEKLVEKGYNVIIVSSNMDDFPVISIENNIKVYRLPIFNLINGRYPILKKNREFKQAIIELEKETIDFAIINTRFYIHSLFGVRFADRHNIKSLVIEHGSSHLSVNNKLFDKLGAIFEHALTARVKHYCNDYYGVSKACNEWLEHFNIQAKGVIHNAINLEKVQHLLDNSVTNFRRDNRISEDSILITYTGRLIPEKGLPSLLKAFEQIKQDNCYLFLAGDGPMYDEIQKMNIERVHLLGRIDMSSIIGLLKESDIFCLPSFSEGFSTSILEAAACKTFIITTKQGGASELLLDDSYGIVLPNNSAEEVVGGIKQALTMTKLERRMASEKTYEVLKTHFVWDIISQQVIDIANLPR